MYYSLLLIKLNDTYYKSYNFNKIILITKIII